MKLGNDTYIEQLEFEDKRRRPNWQSSIRAISPSAYHTIINMSGGLISVSNNVDIEALKADLKASIDELYLNNNHQSLIDIISLSTMLVQQYGVKVN